MIAFLFRNILGILSVFFLSMNVSNAQGGWLGVEVTNIDSESYQEFGLTDARGAYIVDIRPGPAFGAGLKPGDILLSLDDHRLENIEDLIARLSSKSPGTRISLTLNRDRQSLRISAVLGARRSLGTPILGLALGRGENRVEIASVDTRSQAYGKGLRRGDVITEMGQQKVATVYDVIDRLSEAKDAGRNSILLLVRREGEPRFVALSLPTPLWTDQGFASGPLMGNTRTLVSGSSTGDAADHRYTDWIAKGDWTVLGQVIESQNPWQLTLKDNNRYSFWIGGNSSEGRYRVTPNSICFVVDSGSEEVCRTPQFLDKRMAWFQEESDGYVSEIVGVYQTSELPAPTPQPRVSSSVSEKPKPTTSRPKACSNVSSFCTRLSLKAAVCGFAGQTALDHSLGTDTGGLGGAATGAACTALLSEAEGLTVDIVDLAIAAIGSAAMEDAQRNLSDGNIGEALGSALFGTFMGAVGVAKCEATLRNACR